MKGKFKETILISISMILILLFITNIWFNNNLNYSIIENLLFSSFIILNSLLLTPYFLSKGVIIPEKKRKILKSACYISVILNSIFIFYYLNYLSYVEDKIIIDIVTLTNIFIIVYIGVLNFTLIRQIKTQTLLSE
jgi:hypothetical protein